MKIGKDMVMKLGLVKKWFLPGLLIILTMMTASYAYSSKDSIPVRIKVVMEDNYPPYCFRDSHGNLQGITVEQWKLWEKRTDIRVEIRAMDWNLALNAAEARKFDVIDTIFKNPEREKILAFTKPYASIDVAIFFHRNISGITGIDSLHGFKIGVKKGDNCINILKQHGIKDYKEYPNFESIVEAAKSHKILVYIMDKPAAFYYLYKFGIENSFKSSPQLLYTGKLSRAVPKGKTKLLHIVETGFAKISAREYRKIEARWMGTSYETINLLHKYAVWIVAVLFTALLLVIWNITLSKMVNHKTKELVAMVEEAGQREKKLQALLQAVPDVLFVMDKDGTYLECYAKDETILLFPADYHINKSVREILPENLAAQRIRNIRYVLENNTIHTEEYPVEGKQTTHHFEARIFPFDKDKALVVLRDITAKKLSEIKIYEMSIYDSLTGLFNRNYFEDKLNEAGPNDGSNTALVLCDLDGLKMINDTLGHDVGDQCLKIVAAELRVNFREPDMVARIGGDEFAVIMKNTSLAEINAIRKKFKKDIAGMRLGTAALPISVSLGYSFSESAAPNMKNLFKEADDYMYREKLHQQQSARSEIVNVLLRMLEARDFITEGHGERMQDMAAELAERLGFNEQEINDIRLLAQFHDIGKVGISDAILFKPGKLTKAEYKEMQRHAEIGFRIAKSIPDLTHIADWIYKHHEWWNGTGYPLGLSDKEIPVQCRILSIVDAFDAMTSDRPYRKALPVEAALDQLKSYAGSQFDPEFVRCFVAMIHNETPNDKMA